MSLFQYFFGCQPPGGNSGNHEVTKERIKSSLSLDILNHFTETAHHTLYLCNPVNGWKVNVKLMTGKHSCQKNEARAKANV